MPPLTATGKILDGIPVGGGGLGAFLATSVAGASVTGHGVKSSDGRRPLQPVQTASPTGAPAAVLAIGAGGTLVHTFSDGKLDELHVWVNNPGAGALAAVGWGIPSTALPAGVTYGAQNDPAVAAVPSLKINDGPVGRDGTAVRTEARRVGKGGRTWW